jgi:hypothetical protein
MSYKFFFIRWRRDILGLEAQFSRLFNQECCKGKRESWRLFIGLSFDMLIFIIRASLRSSEDLALFMSDSTMYKWRRFSGLPVHLARWSAERKVKVCTWILKVLKWAFVSAVNRYQQIRIELWVRCLVSHSCLVSCTPLLHRWTCKLKFLLNKVFEPNNSYWLL